MVTILWLNYFFWNAKFSKNIFVDVSVNNAYGFWRIYKISDWFLDKRRYRLIQKNYKLVRIQEAQT